MKLLQNKLILPKGRIILLALIGILISCNPIAKSKEKKDDNRNDVASRNTLALLAAIVQNASKINVTTLAGSGLNGSTDGTGTAASFYQPYGVAVNSIGTIYVADNVTNIIREITSSGVVTTFAGSGSSGSTNGTGTAASFNQPRGIAVDSSGTIYVADTFNNKIRKITSSRVVTTFAGSGTTGSTDATGTAASFNRPRGIAVDSNGTIYVADYGNNKIRKITTAGVVSTFAGSGSVGFTDGVGSEASFYQPFGVALDSNSTLYVADLSNNKIRKITTAGLVTTFAGSGLNGSTDGTGIDASFYSPYGVTVANSGIIYVADEGNNKIRKITTDGVVTSVAGSGFAGSADGVGVEASFYSPRGLVVDSAGSIYIADTSNNKIRKITFQ